MTPGRLGACCWVWILSLVSHVSTLCAQEGGPAIGYGLTNIALGQAVLSPHYYSGAGWTVNELRSNGLDGVSLILGEPDSGVYFAPMVPSLTDGHFMYANTYGRLNDTNNMLLCRVWGGRASETVYPLNLDFSPLGPQSVTYQIYWNGVLQREFTRGQPMVVIGGYYYGYYPVVNPLERQRDGTLGASIDLNDVGDFVFPDMLTSARGDRIFIRINNPTNQLGNVSRLDIFGGGGMESFWFNSVALGVFHRRHYAFGRATLHAAPGSLRLGNLSDTDDVPSVLIELAAVGGFIAEFLPFTVDSSLPLVQVASVGSLQHSSQFLGALRFNHQEDGRVRIDYDQELTPNPRIVVLDQGAVVHDTAWPETVATVTIPSNTPIRAITASAKRLEALPGYSVKFSHAAPVTMGTNGAAFTGDEVRFLVPSPVRIEHLFSLQVGGRGQGSITITNETAIPKDPPPRLDIARTGDDVVLTWPDPNQLFTLQQSYFYLPSAYYFYSVTNITTFTDPYSTVRVPIVKTNNVHFFRLWAPNP